MISFTITFCITMNPVSVRCFFGKICIPIFFFTLLNCYFFQDFDEISDTGPSTVDTYIFVVFKRSL